MAFIKKINLQNYRNHETLTLTFGNGINLIVGGNARGKTNILESIYFLGRGKSFRVKDHRDLIRWQNEDCRIKAEFQLDTGTDEAHAYLDNSTKTFKLNGKKKRAYTGVGMVLFVPQDITIFNSTPSARRSYLNEYISGLDTVYKSTLREYTKIVAHRNRILKEIAKGEISYDSSAISVWNDRLVEVGTDLILKRKRWVQDINNLLTTIYQSMGGVGDSLLINYQAQINPKSFDREDVKAAFEHSLKEYEDLEVIRQATMAGPHRDDWAAFVDGRDVKSFGSQGQKRVTALSLKVAELKIAKRVYGEPPLLLLDDVVSELDEFSSEKLLKFVSDMDGQVFITSTSKDFIEKKSLESAKIFEVGN